MKGREGNGKKCKIHYIQVQIPHDKCDCYVCQKRYKRRKNGKKEIKTLSFYPVLLENTRGVDSKQHLLGIRATWKDRVRTPTGLKQRRSRRDGGEQEFAGMHFPELMERLE